MILLCDEDIGTRIPRALSLVRYRTTSIVQRGWAGWADTRWLKIAGNKKWLVFSSKKMLQTQDELDTIKSEKVGIVFLTNGEERLPHVLKLLLNKWEWLHQIDTKEKRPFAFFLYPNGRIKKQTI